MFIYTVRASTLKFFCVIALSVAVLCAVILTIPEYTPVSTKAVAAESAKYSYDKIKTSDDIVSFLSQFGWEVDGTPLEEVKIRIPMEFDKVMNSYNELQDGDRGLTYRSTAARRSQDTLTALKTIPTTTARSWLTLLSTRHA